MVGIGESLMMARPLALANIGGPGPTITETQSASVGKSTRWRGMTTSWLVSVRITSPGTRTPTTKVATVGEPSDSRSGVSR